MRGTYTPNLVILAHLHLELLWQHRYMMYFTKLTSVNLDVGQVDPYTISQAGFP